MADNYHKRPEWSYSSMKKILDSGIDYAVAAKNGDLGEPASSAIDLGQLAHMLVLGGEDTFAISPYENFRKKEAQEWRDAQIADGKNIITDEQFKAVTQIVKNIEDHPLSKECIYKDGVKFEQEMYAKTSNGVDIRGKADVIHLAGKDTLVVDLKTTAQFDKFTKNAYWMHYDLQTVVYMLIAASIEKVRPEDVRYLFCVAESVAPFRVQYFEPTFELIESGENKLRICEQEIIKFGNKKPNFLIEEIGSLGDWSIQK